MPLGRLTTCYALADEEQILLGANAVTEPWQRRFSLEAYNFNPIQAVSFLCLLELALEPTWWDVILLSRNQTKARYKVQCAETLGASYAVCMTKSDTNWVMQSQKIVTWKFNLIKNQRELVDHDCIFVANDRNVSGGLSEWWSMRVLKFLVRDFFYISKWVTVLI